jgi:hypothetical protein
MNILSEKKCVKFWLQNIFNLALTSERLAVELRIMKNAFTKDEIFDAQLEARIEAQEEYEDQQAELREDDEEEETVETDHQ